MDTKELKENYELLLSITAIEEPKKIYKIFEDKNLTCCAKNIYFFIYFKSGNYKYISYLHLSEKIGLSVTYIVKALQELKDNKLITINKSEKIISIK